MRGVRDFFVRGALGLAVALPLYFLVAALLTRFGVLDWKIGFGLMTFRLGPLLLMGTAGVALIALGLSLLVTPRRGRRLALLALLVPAAGILYGGYVGQQAQQHPIADITTAPTDPPEFGPATLAAREASGATNPTDFYGKTVPQRSGPYGGMRLGEVISRLYPDLRTLYPATDSAAAFARAEATAKALGWTITLTDPASGRIEAHQRSLFFGFTDDIVIRVRTQPDGRTAVDVRSLSRVGQSDLGANARRIRAFLARYSQG